MKYGILGRKIVPKLLSEEKFSDLHDFDKPPWLKIPPSN